MPESKNPFGGEDEVIQKDGRLIFNPQFEWTGGGMITTSKDLSRWAKMMYESKAFSKDMLAEMLKGVDSPRLGKRCKIWIGCSNTTYSERFNLWAQRILSRICFRYDVFSPNIKLLWQFR